MKKSRPNSNKDLVIVGIGSSAGGLEALRLFLSNLPPEHNNIAYVVVQHLSPTHKSMMRELLARETTFDVLEIQSGLLPKANTVYITPPDRDVVLKNGLFLLEQPLDRWIGPKPSVDKFFISLSKEKLELAVGVILFGTGSDGSQGVRAIRAEGGIAIAQKIEQAKYDGMPASAIRTKSVDYILPAEDIAKEIIHLLRYPNSLRVEQAEDDEFNIIFEIIRNRFNIDFSQYKKSTITRRIERRMAAIKATTLTDYIAYLKDNIEEVEFLYKDMLIGVTSFFRDTDAFDGLRIQLQEYVNEHKDDEQFRVWVSACSTGEEAYSIAILLDEIMGAQSNKLIKIFATDIDEEAVQKARAGIFPELTVSDVSPERLQKYFIQKGNEFAVKPQLKEKVIFSRHDITIDPPFVKIDLVTCRNMLIYFETVLQKKIFTTFAYSLKQHGLLFLGKSESVGINTDLYSTVDSKAKIFQTRTTVESRKLLYPQMLNAGQYIKPSVAIKGKKGGNRLEEAIKNTLFDYYDSRCVVVDNDFNIHYIKGNMNDMLKFPSGQVHNNILKMLPEKVSLEVRSLVYKANKNEALLIFPAIAQCVLETETISIKLTPLEGQSGNYLYFLICFDSQQNKIEKVQTKTIENENSYVTQLEQELLSTREHLQTVVEELETSNEELQSSNEELQASNEELQASNEELETTNEELQSTNEELQTAYAEIRALYEKQNLQKNYLEDKTNELGILKEELDLQYLYVKEVLDTERNIVIVTNGKELLSANEAFFKLFSRYSSLEEFKAEHQCICEFFEKNNDDGYIYEKKNGINWLSLIINSSRNDLKVDIKKDDITYTYHIMANMLKGVEKSYVVTLTDISQIIASKAKIEMALLDEMQNKVVGYRLMHRFFHIFGNDLFITQTADEIRKPLNKIYQNYKTILEVSNFSDTETLNYLTQFSIYKDGILNALSSLRYFSGMHKGNSINIYEAFERISLLMANSRTNFLNIELLGDQDIEFVDKSGQFYQFIMLFTVMNIRIIDMFAFKNITLKINLKKKPGVIYIGISNTGDESLCRQILKIESSKDILDKKSQEIYDTFSLFNAMLQDTYNAKFISGIDGCEIQLPIN